jgi:hypothetical protein
VSSKEKTSRRVLRGSKATLEEKVNSKLKQTVVALEQRVVPPEGEWHRTEENEDILKRLCHKVYGKEVNVGVAHHICVYEKCDGRLVREWPSVETMLFDHGFARELWGTEWIVRYLEPLVGKEPERRLEVAARWLDERYGKEGW